MASACIFCEVVTSAAPALIVFENDDCIAFLDRTPVFEGHTLVVPKEHVETLNDLTRTQLMSVFTTTQHVERGVVTAMEAHGSFVAMNNVVSQSVPHVHIHIVPRKRKDGLRGFFWPRTRYKSDQHALHVRDRIRAVLKD